MSSFSGVKDLVAFLYTQRISGFEVPVRPHFDVKGAEFFERALSECRSYVEYGSGGSTVLAAKLGKPFVTVESDKYFLEAVKRALKYNVGPNRGHLLHADIGMVQAWGYPLFQTPTPARIKLWRGYAQAPWRYLGNQKAALPDLVLVNGRFRVACALTTLLQLRKTPFRLVVDDYEGRDDYETIEAFAQLEAMHGRMAVFRAKKVDPKALQAEIAAHSSNPD